MFSAMTTQMQTADFTLLSSPQLLTSRHPVRSSVRPNQVFLNIIIKSIRLQAAPDIRRAVSTLGPVGLQPGPLSK
jgi:hypothetical protein